MQRDVGQYAYGWLDPTEDIHFIHRRRPRDIAEMFQAKNSEWLALFRKWAVVVKEEDAKEFKAFEVAHKLRRLRGREGTAGQQIRHWDARAREFFEECGRLRAFEEELVRSVKAELGAGATPKAVTAGRNRELRRMQERQRRIAALDARRMAEAVMLHHTEASKPQFFHLYEAFHKANWPEMSHHHARLDAIYTDLLGAEAKLRDETTHTASADDVAVKEAFQQYLCAWHELSDEVLAAGRTFQRWARKQAALQMREDFASAFPVLHIVLTAIDGLVSTLRVGLLIASVGTPLAPLTVPLLAALAVAQEAVGQLTRYAVSEAAAADPRIAREHLGASYRDDAQDTLIGEEEVGNAATWTGHAANLIRLWVPASFPSVPALHPLSEVSGAGDVIKKVAAAVNRKPLVPGKDHQGLADAFDTSVAGAPLVMYPAAMKSDTVWPGGGNGTVIEGRFHRADRSGGYRAAVERFVVKEFSMLPQVGLLLLRREEDAKPFVEADLLEGQRTDWREAEDGTFQVRTRVLRGVEVYQVAFLLTAEGQALSLGGNNFKSVYCEEKWPHMEFLWVQTPAGRRISCNQYEVALCGLSDRAQLTELDELLERWGFARSCGLAARREDNVLLLSRMDGEPRPELPADLEENNFQGLCVAWEEAF
ncbi:hypothetical protein ACIQWN_32570 [Streptomyces vinaceus]|uniref:hypothetical protein n=1 Tax=Streptomyces vinaceus TaxID=1960 RepID=UPI0037F5564C